MATRLPYYAGEGDIYSQIMQQMQGQPLAFANPYGAGFTGGYNPRLYDRPPVVAPTPAPDTSGLLGGGDSGYGMPASGGAMNPASMISAGQALQGYGRSFGGFAPFGTIAGLLGYGLTSYGINQLGEMERAAAQAEADRAAEAAARDALAGLSSAEVGQAEADAVAAAEAAAAAESMGNALAADIAAANAAADMGGLLGMSDASVGQAEADAVAAAEAAAAAESMGNAQAADVAAANAAAADSNSGYGGTGAASSDASGGYGGVDSGGYGGDGSGGYYYKGGKVTMNGLLTDVDPPGPDEGYGALQVGEYVIKKSTAKKLGDKKLNALNQGRATIKMRK
jgi:hypothetical protein